MPDSSSSTSSTSSSDSSGSSSSEDEGMSNVARMSNPTLGVATDASSTEDEYVPNPGLNVGPPSNPGSPVDHAPKTPLWDDDDTDTERPTKIQRCSLCYDFDQLLEDHLFSSLCLCKADAHA